MANSTSPSKGDVKTIEDITEDISNLSLISFRKRDDIKRFAHHFKYVINHPQTQDSPIVLKYMQNLENLQRKIYAKKHDGVQVEYTFTPQTKSNLQRQRFNSLPVSEVSELLKTEFPSTENAEQIHICTDCNVSIELNDEEPLMESLQKHFNLEVHMPKPKRESVDVAEPIVLPNMSRRLSALESGDVAAVDAVTLAARPTEKLDRLFLAKLEASLIRQLADNSESNINNALKFYQEVYDKLCQEISGVDFAAITGTVAPIIMSIKDNVNQNFSTDANKNFETEDNEQSTPEKPMKNQIKKHRYYGPVENDIINLLKNHKLMPLVDDRTGKPAFFCITCEYYTLRFRYDSVLNHVFSETHIHNLACILQADKHIPFVSEHRTIEKIKDMNKKFLFSNTIGLEGSVLNCSLCRVSLESQEVAVLHVLEENHLCKVSDRLYRKFKTNNPIAQIPENWGSKNLDWAKYLGGTGKGSSNKDHVFTENFIKASGKIANYCPCCDTTLKGPRQILFNHIRQKKHLRNAAPHKLSILYKNYARPAEYYAGFGNFFLCTMCPEYDPQPAFAGIIDHIECERHVDTIAKLIKMALIDEYTDKELMTLNKITTEDDIKCCYCDLTFIDMHDAVLHVLSSIQHQNYLADAKYNSNKGDIISIYMRGHYILHSEGATFNCVVCNGVFSSLRSLLMHLIYAEHLPNKPSSESVFRFYLELKHNVNLLVRNKYVYSDFGKLRCGVCDVDLEENEGAKKHVGTARHRESVGASYVNLQLDVSATE